SPGPGPGADRRQRRDPRAGRAPRRPGGAVRGRRRAWVPGLTGMRFQVTRLWQGPGGGREVLGIAYPLILSQLSFTLQTFADRLFLTWYSAEAVAGAVTGLFATWALIGLFIGTGEFLTTFVAQYLGAGRPERIGPAMWQGI